MHAQANNDINHIHSINTGERHNKKGFDFARNEPKLKSSVQEVRFVLRSILQRRVASRCGEVATPHIELVTYLSSEPQGSRRGIYVMMCKTHVLLIALIAIVVGCSGDPLRNGPESGEVVDGVYVNEYLGLKLPIPDNFFVWSKDTQQHLMETGEGAVVGDDAVLKAAVEASKKTTFQLLTLSQFEMGAAVEFNPNLGLMAERVNHLPGIKSGADYLIHATTLLSRVQLPYELKNRPYSTQIGDRQWDRADFLINQPQMPFSQSYICTKNHDFVLLMVLTAATSEQMAALERVASSIVLEETQ